MNCNCVVSPLINQNKKLNIHKNNSAGRERWATGQPMRPVWPAQIFFFEVEDCNSQSHSNVISATSAGKSVIFMIVASIELSSCRKDGECQSIIADYQKLAIIKWVERIGRVCLLNKLWTITMAQY